MKRMVITVALVAMVCAPAWGDSLFNREVAKRGSLVSNRRAQYEVGDIITVMVRETVDASTKADTKTKKESEISAEANAAENNFLVAPRPTGLSITTADRLPNWGIEAENEHKSKGDTRRTNRLVMTVSCTVTRVYDNGNIDIEGEKKITVNREESHLYVKGTVRSNDVTISNTVNSNQIANATIELKGRGPLWNNQRRGILTRVLDWFSPF